MRVNANFDERVVVRFDETPWVPSPSPGVERKMLDRIGGEVARATTIVRFAPNSQFAPHTHDGGEEYIVLDGVFQDELGDFPSGMYVRNPPTSRHTPATAPGCMIFVKLHQFDPADREEVRIDTSAAGADELFSDKGEHVRMLRLEPGEMAQISATDGLEAFVLAGSVTESADHLGKWDWLRLPVDAKAEFVAGDQGAKLWVKTGHLRQIRMPETA